MADHPDVVLDYGETVVVKSKSTTIKPLEFHSDAPDATRVRVTAPAAPPPTDPGPVPVPGTNILGIDLTKLPRTTAAWDRVLAASKNLGPVTLTDTSGSNNGELLAAALIAGATGDSVLKSKVISTCSAALSGPHARTLEQARNLAPIALALSFVGDHSLDVALRRERDYKADSQGSVIDCHKKRPNNWGTCSGLARIAVDAHVGDKADLQLAVAVFRGWLGERAVYAGFAYGDTSWQADPAKPVGINPRGATKLDGVTAYNVDGILPDDQRRASAFPKYVCENYVFQALGEVFGTLLIVRANGYPDASSWSDAAIARAYGSLKAHGCKATGDDGWQYAAAAFLGVPLAHDGYAPGKSFGWVDWLLGVTA